MAGPFSLTFMSGGNKAWLLTVITCLIIASGGIVLVVSPNNNQDTGEPVKDESEFDVTIAPNITGNRTQRPTTAPTSKPPIPLFLPTTTPAPTPRPTLFVPVPDVTVAPSRMPVYTQPTSTSAQAPIPGTPVIGAVRQYPFALVFECDWQGNRLSFTTKTISSSVTRLCIEAPPLPPDEAPVEIAYLNTFIFSREAYEDTEEVLEPLLQHSVIGGKPDPFGLTLINCPPGVRICRFATDLRDEFFTHDAFLVGQGELALQFVQEPKSIAGIAPITIYFLLSKTDIVEPIILGRRADPVVANNNPKILELQSTSSTTTTTSSRPVGRGHRKQNAFRNKGERQDPSITGGAAAASTKNGDNSNNILQLQTTTTMPELSLHIGRGHRKQNAFLNKDNSGRPNPPMSVGAARSNKNSNNNILELQTTTTTSALSRHVGKGHPKQNAFRMKQKRHPP
ncbi:expressed unknown protein [Seminavis robusta]|uniref:Uncharacterized protein n=1 Tax=Seminavis robusta TaxID=568900 RepID=A0A9N8HGJ9_9STRA|nr:expressed unknown protein [Seminavis robusta]|eukprot:Sro488_g153090.1 n/a (452) ;mRNA; r:30555-31910